MLQTKTINPIAIDGRAIEVLAQDPNLSVHSTFANTINFKTSHGLVIVTRNEDVMPPLGVVLSEADYELFCNGNHKLKVAGSRLYDPTLTAFNRLPDRRVLDIYLNRFFQDDRKNGLGVGNDELASLFDGVSLSTLSEDARQLWKFAHSKGSECLDKVIGRGMGLTPSGDDFAVGFLAALKANGLGESMVNNLEDLIVGNRGKITTDISEDFILKSLKGQFSQNIIQLINSIQINVFDEKSYLNVIKYGETSGVDTFVGIMAGYASIV